MRGRTPPVGCPHSAQDWYVKSDTEIGCTECNEARWKKLDTVCRSAGESRCETQDNVETRNAFATELEAAARVIRESGQDFEARTERRLFFRRRFGTAEVIGRRMRITIEIREGHQNDA